MSIVPIDSESRAGREISEDRRHPIDVVPDDEWESLSPYQRAMTHLYLATSEGEGRMDDESAKAYIKAIRYEGEDFACRDFTWPINLVGLDSKVAGGVRRIFANSGVEQHEGLLGVAFRLGEAEEFDPSEISLVGFKYWHPIRLAEYELLEKDSPYIRVAGMVGLDEEFINSDPVAYEALEMVAHETLRERIIRK